jgi:hypothetical protein
MKYIGDIRLGDTFDVKFTSTAAATGAPTTLSGSPVISAYPGNSTTELTAGITLSVDFDSRTGLNNVRVVATGGNGYATATDYSLVITAGTVGGTSAVGYEIAQFSIEKRSALMPATAARTLVVDAAGLADANAVKLGPTGAGTAQTARDIGLLVLANVTQVASVAVPPRYTGTSQAATLATITLAASTTALQAAIGDIIVITSGVGVGQSGIIASQSGMGTATPIVTITNSNGGWATLPTASGYEIVKAGQVVPVVATTAGNLPSDLRALGGVAMVGDGSIGNNLRPTGIAVG